MEPIRSANASAAACPPSIVLTGTILTKLSTLWAVDPMKADTGASDVEGIAVYHRGPAGDGLGREPRS